jgi:hypothetical protein
MPTVEVAPPKLITGSYNPFPTSNDAFATAVVVSRDAQTANNVTIDGLKMGTSFDGDDAVGDGVFRSDRLAVSFMCAGTDPQEGHTVTVQVQAPSPAEDAYADAPSFGVGRGGHVKYTLEKPAAGWPEGDWLIAVTVDGDTAASLSFSGIDDGEGLVTLATSQDALGLSETEEVWHVDGYVPEDITYGTVVLGNKPNPPGRTAACAYLSDDGKIVFTTYPAALSASDGSKTWEGDQHDSDSLALAGNGIYELDESGDPDGRGPWNTPVRRIWPQPKSYATAKAAVRGTKPHVFSEHEPLADRGLLAKVRSRTWEVNTVRADPSGRYHLFYERATEAVAGSRDRTPAEWKWMVYDTAKKRILYTRSATEVGLTFLQTGAAGTTDEVPTDGDPRILMLSNGRFIAGAHLVGPTQADDRSLIGNADLVVRGVSRVEGSDSDFVVHGTPGDEAQSNSESTVSLIYNADLNKRFPAPDGGILSASRDGMLILSMTGPDSENEDAKPGLTLTRLCP